MALEARQRPRRGARAAGLIAIATLVCALEACTAGGASPTRSVGLEGLPSPSSTPLVSAPGSVGPHAGIAGRVLAGPTCPVERVPPDPACAPRGVPGAVIVITNAAGTEVARVTSGPEGTYLAVLPAGTYTLTPQPIAGLLGVAAPAQATVPAQGDGPTVDFSYDTGIR